MIMVMIKMMRIGSQILAFDDPSKGAHTDISNDLIAILNDGAGTSLEMSDRIISYGGTGIVVFVFVFFGITFIMMLPWRCGCWLIIWMMMVMIHVSSCRMRHDVIYML